MVEGQRNSKFSQNNKLDHSCATVTKVRLYEFRVRDRVMHLGLNVSSSALNYECVVDGGNDMSGIYHLTIVMIYSLWSSKILLVKVQWQHSCR